MDEARRRGASGRLDLLVVLFAVVLLGLWRIVLVQAGPDGDSDAYAHHVIARQLLADPTDLRVQWVWLPLFHYLQVIPIACGATLDTIRYANVAVWGGVALLVYARTRRCERALGTWSARVAPVAAALFCALSAIGMQMGTTGQPEPLFCLALLAVVEAQDRRAFVAAACLLTAACLLRYEAWAVLPVVAYSAYASRAVDASSDGPRRFTRWLPVVLPILAILGWATLRRPVDGGWFAFLRQTREFANGALNAKSSLDEGVGRVALDSIYYAVQIPMRVMGLALVLVPLGLLRTWRTQGPLFVLVYAACLGFLTLTWIMRSSLGLERHFVALVPFYAIAAGNGLAQVIDVAYARKRGLARAAWLVVAAALGVVGLGASVLLLDSWMHDWRGAMEGAFHPQIALGAYLRSLPPQPIIFCDESTVEILSGLDRHRFDRHRVDEPGEPARVIEAARAGGIAYVATWTGEVKKLGPIGDVSFIAPEERPDDVKEDDTLRVLRVTRPTPQSNQ